MTKIPWSDLESLNVRVADLIKMPDGPDRDVAKMCRVVVDRLIDKLKPYLNNACLSDERKIPITDIGNSIRTVFLIMTLPDGCLYLDGSGNFVRTDVFGKIVEDKDLPAGYGSWVYASHFGLLISAIDHLLEKAEKQPFTMEKRKDALEKIVTNFP